MRSAGAKMSKSSVHGKGPRNPLSNKPEKPAKPPPASSSEHSPPPSSLTGESASTFQAGVPARPPLFASPAERQRLPSIGKAFSYESAKPPFGSTALQSAVPVMPGLSQLLVEMQRAQG